jgi:hypothetical protein
MKKDNLQLVYIHNLGLNAENKFHYNFFFVPKDLTLCNENWQEDIAGLYNEKYVPDENTEIYSLITSIPLALITDNLCLGMKNAIDGIVALAWEDISDYEEYPEEGRLILYYGMSLKEVEELLENKDEKLVK